MVALLVVGYGYGILRANFPTDASHFIFDGGVLGLYAAVFMTPAQGQPRYRSLSLQPWVAALTAWPLLLFFVPKQDWLIQLVGLRGAVFFVPFLLIGARRAPARSFGASLSIAVYSRKAGSAVSVHPDPGSMRAICAARLKPRFPRG